MRFVRFLIIFGIVILSFCALLKAGNFALSFSYLSLLERGERGVVKRMVEKGLNDSLENYHLQNIGDFGINLPQASKEAIRPHPDVERFFYVDASGNITIKGLSDKNIPEDLSQKCLLIADKNLLWYKTRLLLDAFINEKIRNVYLVGITPEGRLTYTLFEVTAPGPFPMLYRYRICLLGDNEFYSYYEEDSELTPFNNFSEFNDISTKIKDVSTAKKPFLRIVSMYGVSIDALHRCLAMFEPAGVQAIVKLRSDDTEYILSEAAELAGKSKQKDKEE